MQIAVLTKALAGLATLAPLASGSPLSKRAVIDHDAVVGFPETVPEGVIGELYLKYKPRLKIFEGCVPFPGVQADGGTRYVPHHVPTFPSCGEPESNVRTAAA